MMSCVDALCKYYTYVKPHREVILSGTSVRGVFPSVLFPLCPIMYTQCQFILGNTGLLKTVAGEIIPGDYLCMMQRNVRMVNPSSSQSSSTGSSLCHTEVTRLFLTKTRLCGRFKVPRLKKTNQIKKM